MFKFTKLFPLFGLLVLAPPAPSPSSPGPLGTRRVENVSTVWVPCPFTFLVKGTGFEFVSVGGARPPIA